LTGTNQTRTAGSQTSSTHPSTRHPSPRHRKQFTLGLAFLRWLSDLSADAAGSVMLSCFPFNVISSFYGEDVLAKVRMAAEVAREPRN